MVFNREIEKYLEIYSRAQFFTTPFMYYSLLIFISKFEIKKDEEKKFFNLNDNKLFIII